MLVTCAKEDPNIYSETIGYKLIHFADYEQKGVYVLDTRHFLKTTVYYFDFVSEGWSAAADDSGLPPASRSVTANVASAFSYSRDSLLIITGNGDFFYYDKVNHKWYSNSGGSQYYYYSNYHYSYYYSHKPYRYYLNTYDNQIYKTNLASFSYTNNDSIYFYKLINQTEWQLSAVFVDDTAHNKFYLATIPVDKGRFMNIFRYEIIDHISENPFERSFNILIFNLLDSTSNYTGELYLDGYLPDRFYYLNGTIYFHNNFNAYNGNYEITGNYYAFYKIADNTPVKLGEDFSVMWDSDENIENWNEIEYVLQSTSNLFLYNDSFYFFIDDMVYKLSPGSSSWTKLSSIPFKTLNRKTE
ncbi:MAG: hypothetical protein R6W78_04720 [Bacteroidales bacterium]